MNLPEVRRVRKEGSRMVPSPKGHWIRHSEYVRDIATLKCIVDQLPVSHIDLAMFFHRIGLPPADQK